MLPKTAAKLRSALPAGAVIDDPLQLRLYSYDGTLHTRLPELVVLPESTEQVVAVARICHEMRVPLVPRGAATSLSGGPIPLRGGVVVALTRMDRIIELDLPNQRAVVQPGVVNIELQDALDRQGYLYAPDPASQTVCTLGGNIAENSGGPHCLKYGVTSHHVLGLEVVLPDGRVLRTGGKSLDWPGYDLMGVLIGSEGTFGIVTEITCRVMPKPEAIVTMLAVFDSLAAAVQSVSDIIADRLVPATLEMMDRPMIRAVEASVHAGYPLDAEAVLIIELDGLQAALPEQVSRVQAACRRNDVTSFQVARDETERALLWKGRKGAFGAIVNVAPTKLSTDVTVSRTRLPEMLERVMEIGRKWDVPIANVLHAGDGNLHPQVLYDPRDPEQVRRVMEVDHEITELAVALGGVLSGEHGIGCSKRKYMSQMFNTQELLAMWRIKEVFDPDLILNPDKVLPALHEIGEPEPVILPEGDFAHAGPAVAVRDERGWFAPVDEEALQKVLAVANRERQPLILRGAGTKLGPTPEGVEVVSTARLNRIVAYDYANLTVTAQCGITLAEIEAAAAEHEQMLPIRPRFAGSCTLGGVVSCSESGPHRLLYGSTRDVVTGVKAAMTDGQPVRFGSSCVKNVSGFAVEKLLTGSRGALGAILEVTVRTLPRPEHMRTLALPADNPLALQPLLAALLASPLRPAAIEALNSTAAGMVGETQGRWVLLLGLEGFRADVEEMESALGKLAVAHRLGRWQPVEDGYLDIWARVTDLDVSGMGAPMLRASCLPVETMALAAQMTDLDPKVALRAGPGLGLVHASVLSKLGLRNYSAQSGQLAAGHGGVCGWLAPTPAGLAPMPDEVCLDMCRRLKQAFDPNNILPFEWQAED